tara:strand:+ start:28878 stop:29264 length:387 start_codon:yes stop_codon:yes gene_type:complete
LNEVLKGSVVIWKDKHLPGAISTISTATATDVINSKIQNKFPDRSAAAKVLQYVHCKKPDLNDKISAKDGVLSPSSTAIPHFAPRSKAPRPRTPLDVSSTNHEHSFVSGRQPVVLADYRKDPNRSFEA